MCAESVCVCVRPLSVGGGVQRVFVSETATYRIAGTQRKRERAISNDVSVHLKAKEWKIIINHFSESF